ncbi:MAG: hypothetical protein K5659_09035 [Lachnospiraceae bacterium]|nr:hypothetical protein [Lachnospiraceae bacterium]
MPLETSIDIATAWLEEISTGRQVKLGEIKEISLTQNENDEIRLSGDRVLISSEPVTILNKDRLKAFSIFALTGNDLYLRFPKKLRRRRRR